MNNWTRHVGIASPVPTDRPVALMVRHAERPPIPEGQVGMELPLTEDGARAATMLGEAIGRRLGPCRSSPVRRCVETARALMAGAVVSASIAHDTMLGEPGAFISDGVDAWETFCAIRHAGVLRALTHGSPRLRGFLDATEAARALVSHIIGQLGHDGVLVHVHVTHDLLLSATVARACGVAPEETYDPAFLEGIAFWMEGDEPWWAWRHWRRPV